MEYITNELHEILSLNKDRFNLRSVDITKKFNHCTVLIYYTGKNLKEKLSLGYHKDCVCSMSDGSFVKQSNSQVMNTPVVIYSFGDSRTINWKTRRISESLKGRNVWVDNKYDRQSFSLHNDIVNKIDPLDENHLVLTTYKVSHNS